MKIKKLIKDFPSITLKGSKEIDITGVCTNSTLVAVGNLFIAKKGRKYDGSHYISEAISAGAVAVANDIYDPTLTDIAQLIHPNVAEIESLLAAQYYQHPSQELFTVGITGTNGKTTTSYFIKHLLDAIYGPCGVIGTLEYIVGKHHHPATHTTPDVCTNQKILREMLLQGCRSAVMEVSSHALDQQRVNLIDFDCAIFTNLSPEHLDYHVTMEHYAAAKQKLFTSLTSQRKKKGAGWPKTAIMNIDDPWHETMSQGCCSEFFSYGFDDRADLKASDLQMTSSTTQFNLTYKNQSVECSISFTGRHNAYNFMAAVALGLICNLSLEKACDILKNTKAVPGRLEKVNNPLNLDIYVDFAHKPDALMNVLSCLKKLKVGRLITVFGCGGDRDRSKRKIMAEISERYSDFTIVTSDNPRTEDPTQICLEIVQGFSSKGSYCMEIDRKNAICQAIEMARKGDIILIAGKGHEPYQIFAHKTIEFDDRVVALEICQNIYQNAGN